jgi:CheY-like chemotaxis protein
MAKPEDKYILVVDDEEDVRDYLVSVLEDAGFQVEEAADGEEALRKVKEKKPDFISLDLVMPKKSGIKFLHELRRNKEWASIPVLIVTAHAHDELGKTDLDNIFAGKIISGPKVYLEKPVKPEQYIRAICDKLDIECENYSESPDPSHMRSELKGLLDTADPNKLAEIMKILRDKNK